MKKAVSLFAVIHAACRAKAKGRAFAAEGQNLLFIQLQRRVIWHVRYPFVTRGCYIHCDLNQHFPPRYYRKGGWKTSLLPSHSRHDEQGQGTLKEGQAVFSSTEKLAIEMLSPVHSSESFESGQLLLEEGGTKGEDFNHPRLHGTPPSDVLGGEAARTCLALQSARLPILFHFGNRGQWSLLSARSLCCCHHPRWHIIGNLYMAEGRNGDVWGTAGGKRPEAFWHQPFLNSESKQ